jgi:5-methylcytosine-specific restriction endonuclease McrA
MRGRSPSRNPQASNEVKVVKASIPKALREQVWLTYAGRVYERRCLVRWCQNTMSVFDFHVGHDVPESQGGATEIANLRPICARCNLSMGSNYTVQEWSSLSKSVVPWYKRLFCCCTQTLPK